MNEIKNLLSQLMVSNNEVEAIGENFVIYSYTGSNQGVNFDGNENMSLYYHDTLIARYEFEDQELNVMNWEFKKEVKFFADCLENEGFAVYVDEKLTK